MAEPITFAEALLQAHEGYRQHPYRCTAGKVTVGFGRNLDDVGISRVEAEQLLRNDIIAAIAHLRMEPYWLDLDEVRQAVLIDMAVNMGWPRLSRFKEFREALKVADYERAAEEMVDSLWHTQVGARAKRLEALMRSGNRADAGI